MRSTLYLDSTTLGQPRERGTANALNLFHNRALGFIDRLGATLIVHILPILQILYAIAAGAGIRIRKKKLATDRANLDPIGSTPRAESWDYERSLLKLGGLSPVNLNGTVTDF